MEDYLDDKDIDFNLELLAYLTDTGKNHDFNALVPVTLEIISKEEEFHDLLMLCMDYFHRADQEAQENEIQGILQKRAKYLPEEPFKIDDKDKTVLINILKKSLS